MADTKRNGDAPEDFGPHVHVSKHPVLSHKITILRSSTTPTGTFRAVLREVTYHLGYEATMRLTTQPVAISVPKPNTDEHFDYEGRKLKERIALIPKLRSGLGMENPMLELLPKAQVHHVGMYKVSESDPIMYFNRLPRKCQADVAYILDPVIATSSTVMSMIAILKKWGVPQINIICVIASRVGLKQIMEAHPDVYITVGTVDETVTDDGIVLPGMGDAGDRQFGTRPIKEDEESLMHPSRRKRTLSETT